VSDPAVVDCREALFVASDRRHRAACQAWWGRHRPGYRRPGRPGRDPAGRTAPRRRPARPVL